MDSSLFAHRGHALRTGRFSGPGRAYLLTAVTLERKPVFNDWQLARLLIAEMRHAHESKTVESLAWVVMPDHLHWLIELGDTTMQALMQRIKSRSAIAINKSSDLYNGKLWQRGFHDRALRREERYASDCALYSRQPVANWTSQTHWRLSVVGCSLAVTPPTWIASKLAPTGWRCFCRSQLAGDLNWATPSPPPPPAPQPHPA